MRSVPRIPLALICSALCACTSIDEQLATWIGQPREELVAAWGVPTAETPDGRGGTILIYETDTAVTHRPFYSYGHGHRRNDVFIYEGPEYTRYGRSVRSFFVDPDGVVYDYRWGER